MFLKRSDTVELLLIGVEPEWQNRGVVALLFTDFVQVCNKLGFKYAETNAMLESNVKILSMFEPFEKEIHKRRWVFGKEI
jgi:N-acetylglutamate synthase-like GNAT family acetyltransferase